MTTAAAHPYASFLHKVQKPSQYVGGEHGEAKKDWGAVSCRMCLAFPDLYEIGMSHLGYKILYGILNAHPKLLAERAYAPWTDMEKELRARGEKVRSLESARALSEFDVVGFSLQFELTFTNVLLMLDLGGIPLRAAHRGENDPLVIGGGPTATHAEPMAPFFDAFLIGDAEHALPELLLTWAALRDAGMPRAERLRVIARQTGIYVPSLYATKKEADTGFTVIDAPIAPEVPLPVRRAFVPDLNAYPFPTGGPVAATETTFDRVSIEIARGCTEGCRFCQAGMIYRPVRERDPEQIVSGILESVRGGGYDEASLTCLSTADYSAIAPLVKRVMKETEGEKVSLSVSSLRAYGLGEELLDEIQKVRATGLTFAPEAGSQRMRDVVNKNVTEEQLMETAERVFSRGWSKMKLYFMIGLPTEEDDDVRGIVQTGHRAQVVGRKAQKGRIPQVTVSVSTHVPKPHTPFQWCAMDARDEVLRKQGMLREEARQTKVTLRMHDSAGSWVEGFLARGDRTLADVVEGAYRKGARFDSWEEHMDLPAWRSALEESGVDPTIFLGTIPTTARLPWDHIDVGLEDGFLAREYRKSLKNRLSPPCGKVVGAFIHATNVEDAMAETKKLVCYDCGVACDMTKMRQERIEFLVKLGAKTRPLPKTEEEKPRTLTPNERRPKANFDQGEATRVRLGFRKTGRAAYRAHLDLVRLLPRILRRVGLPLFYSQGFHPKPEMVFGPALSLGIASLDEWVDVKLCAGADLHGIVERLSEAADDGIDFTSATLLGPNDRGISKVITDAFYVAAIAKGALTDLGVESEEALVRRIEERRQGALVVRRTIEGIGKDVDVGKYLREVRVGKDADAERALADAGLFGDLVVVSMHLEITGQGTAKASEALEALIGKAVEARLVRAALRGRDRNGVIVSPNALGALRVSVQEPSPALAVAE